MQEKYRTNSIIHPDGGSINADELAQNHHLSEPVAEESQAEKLQSRTWKEQTRTMHVRTLCRI